MVALMLYGCGERAGTKQGSDKTSAPGKRLPDAAAKYVEIAPGMTSLIAEGKLKADTDAEYVFRGEAGSLLVVHATTPKEDPEVSVYRADTGAKLDEAHKNPTFWIGWLPATIGYLVVLHHIGKETEYALEIEVPRVIHFDEATSSAKIMAWAPPVAPIAYLIPKGMKRKLSAELISDSANSYITIHGLDDGRAILNAQKGLRNFEGELPQQDSILRVHQSAGGGEFTLRLALK